MAGEPAHLRVLNGFDFNSPRDLDRNSGDICDPGRFHPTELAVLSGGHSAGDACRGLDELSSFHDEFRLC